MKSTDIVGYEAATGFIDTIQAAGLKFALEYALTTVITHRGMDPNVAPSGGFDLRFFLEAVKAMFEDEKVIRAIAEGKQESLRW